MTGSGARRSHYETWQRHAVLTALEQSAQLLSARALQKRMSRAGRPVALSTVYRALRHYTDTGQVAAIVGPTGERLYRLACTPAAILVCRSCARSLAIDAGVPREWATSVAAEHGFSRLAVTVSVSGLCQACTGLATGGGGGQSTRG